MDNREVGHAPAYRARSTCPRAIILLRQKIYWLVSIRPARESSDLGPDKEWSLEDLLSALLFFWFVFRSIKDEFIYMSLVFHKENLFKITATCSYFYICNPR